MRLPPRLARLNWYLPEPVQRVWAGRAPGLGLVRYRDRTTGAYLSIPVTAFRIQDGFVIPLPDGSDVEWVRNFKRAGGGGIRHQGRYYVIGTPEVLPAAELEGDLSEDGEKVIRLLQATEVLRVPIR
ncbi:nitroreductase family deazaflavin-dependent oxidoreductase [Amycolatopsis sp. CA-230715]|uniref:nitroreductase family deazaflavin-dependent oxidoreductase n=1 Tax=Amycolatopsis sp. CA-230715 TaxID=2745196 RepID=UPI001C03553F|nr:nitroreductase family deazaflavin-dependent oxidoreductase [Amycolatopsis sp. CA-230715]QWF80694.1 hypothetical protein HUW46_04118 [Amycolatopsis sp. CA-230715]